MKIYIIEETKCIVINGELWVRFEEAFPDNVEGEEEPAIIATTKRQIGRAPKGDSAVVGDSAKPKGQKRCGKCGQPGHQARTCTREGDTKRDDVGEQPSPAFRRGGITEEQFDRVKELQTEGESSMAISRDTGIMLVQVGRIMNSDDYEEFLGKS